MHISAKQNLLIDLKDLTTQNGGFLITPFANMTIQKTPPN